MKTDKWRTNDEDEKSAGGTKSAGKGD